MNITELTETTITIEGKLFYVLTIVQYEGKDTASIVSLRFNQASDRFLAYRALQKANGVY